MKPYKTIYHTYCPLHESSDDFTEDSTRAQDRYKKLVADFGEARLYVERYYSAESYDDGWPDEEDCLESTEVAA
jgi:hypothetical protein